VGPKNLNSIIEDSTGHGLKGSGRTSKCPLRVDERLSGPPLRISLARSVSDVSTAGPLKRFYTHLRAGISKDEALLATQIELIRSPEFSHPSLGCFPTGRRLEVDLPPRTRE
jgi:hypothetical protein